MTPPTATPMSPEDRQLLDDVIAALRAMKRKIDRVGADAFVREIGTKNADQLIDLMKRLLKSGGKEPIVP